MSLVELTEQPNNIEAEQALLGSILVNNHGYRRVRAFLRPEHFYEPCHAICYRAVGEIIDAGRVADPITLKGALEDYQDELKPLGGPVRYMAKLARAAETIQNVEDYGRAIVEQHRRRALCDLARDLAATARDQRAAIDSIATLARQIGEVSRPLTEECRRRTLDLSRVKQGDYPETHWLIDQWHPVGAAGMFAGVGSVGKSYLELVKMVCLASGKPFLGYELEPTPVLGYFAEDTEDQIGRRLVDICHELKVDPESVRGRLDIVSTHGESVSLVEANRNDLQVHPSAFFYQVLSRAQAMGARYVSFDNIGRYCHIEYNLNNQQVFDLFTHLDSFARDINGSVCILHHPSKAGVKDVRSDNYRADVYDLVGGAAALVNAPRFVHTLRWMDFPARGFNQPNFPAPPDEDENCEPEIETLRCYQTHKSNHGRAIALKLKEPQGRKVVRSQGEVNLTALEERMAALRGKNPSGKKPRGRPSIHEDAYKAVKSLFEERHVPITIDEVVGRLIAWGSLKKAEENSRSWRDRRATVKEVLDDLRGIEQTPDGTYVLS